jgi:5-formyltetrahydrofolate cyclo-ligase
MPRLLHRGVRVLQPVLGTGMQRQWAFLDPAQAYVEPAPGRPLEPAGPVLEAAALAEADVILVPALAVDTRGYRVGLGGGWYDRALKHAKPDAITIALVYPDEVYDATTRPLPNESHDIPLDLIATTTGWQPTCR